jgi:hypothetical protein
MQRKKLEAGPNAKQGERSKMAIKKSGNKKGEKKAKKLVKSSNLKGAKLTGVQTLRGVMSSRADQASPNL